VTKVQKEKRKKREITLKKEKCEKGEEEKRE
jgi:hypothetical protein